MNHKSDQNSAKNTVRLLQDIAYPLKLVVNSSYDWALGLRYQCEIFYLNFPNVIKIKGIHDKGETIIDESNVHLIDIDLRTLIKIIKSERKRALKHYISIIMKFFFKEHK